MINTHSLNWIANGMNYEVNLQAEHPKATSVMVLHNTQGTSDKYYVYVALDDGNYIAYYGRNGSKPSQFIFPNYEAYRKKFKTQLRGKYKADRSGTNWLVERCTNLGLDVEATPLINIAAAF